MSVFSKFSFPFLRNELPQFPSKRGPGFLTCFFLLGFLTWTRWSDAQEPMLSLPDAFSSNANIRLTQFATGLSYPAGLLIPNPNTLWVAVDEGENFFNSMGRIIELVDADGDGVADGEAQVLMDSLPGGLTTLARLGPWIATLSTNPGNQKLLLFHRTESGEFLSADQVDLSIQSSYHLASTLLMRNSPEQPQNLEVFFQFGSRENNAVGPALNFAALSGLQGELSAASLHRLTFSPSPDGIHLTAIRHDVIATGLRNASALAWDSSNNLIIAENGIDGLMDPIEPTSADEINILNSELIGSSIKDFGFPASYAEYRTGIFIGDITTQPAIAFHPIPHPADGLESEGVSSIAQAPKFFPSGFNQGFFLGFHGQFSSAGLENEENTVLHVDPVSGHSTPFILPSEPGIGHINSLASDSQRLFLADMTAEGNLFTSRNAGKIYLISTSVSLPPTVDFSLSLNRLEPDQIPQPGERLSLVLDIHNPSDVPASQLQIRAVLPEVLVAQKSDPYLLDCSGNSGCLWTFATIPPQTTTSVTLEFLLSPDSSAKSFHISFTLTSDDHDPAPDNNTVAVSSPIISPSPILTLKNGLPVLTFEGRAELETSDQVAGPWINHGRIASPFPVNIPPSNQSLFLRLTW